MAVIKTIELVGVSDRSWRDAAQQALSEAAKTIRQIEGMDVISPSASYAVHTLTAAKPERTSSFVRNNSVSPLTRAAYRSTTASNQPQRRLRPVVTPNSCPIRPSRSPSSPVSSVGNGPAPTRVT